MKNQGRINLVPKHCSHVQAEGSQGRPMKTGGGVVPAANWWENPDLAENEEVNGGRGRTHATAVSGQDHLSPHLGNSVVSAGHCLSCFINVINLNAR